MKINMSNIRKLPRPISPLAHRIMLIALKFDVQIGHTLPNKPFELFLLHLTQEEKEQVGEALLELYTGGLLQEVPHESDILTKIGFEYIHNR